MNIDLFIFIQFQTIIVHSCEPELFDFFISAARKVTVIDPHNHSYWTEIFPFLKTAVQPNQYKFANIFQWKKGSNFAKNRNEFKVLLECKNITVSNLIGSFSQSSREIAKFNLQGLLEETTRVIFNRD